MKNATRTVVSTFGAIMALAGIEHGVGEVLQGNAAPEGLFLLSWPDSDLFALMNGEPAMTIIPNLLVTGIVAILVSAATLVWAVWFVNSKHGGLVMILLSIAMLLFGGGIFPPVFALVFGIIATRINSPHKWYRRLSAGSRQFLGSVYPWVLGAGAACWLALFPGSVIAAYLLGADTLNTAVPDLVLWLAPAAVVFMVLSVVAAFAADSVEETNGVFSPRSKMDRVSF